MELDCSSVDKVECICSCTVKRAEIWKVEGS